MKLSIAFITYNRKNELIRAIQSCEKELVKSLPKGQYECIILDNCSTDGTENAIKNMCKNINLIYKKAEYNLGVAAGRNEAFKLCSGEYVFFLDDDAVIATNNFFETLLSYMEANADVVALSPDIQEPKTGKNLNSNYKYVDGIYSTILSYCGCAHILRKSFFETKDKLYPDNLKFGSEELYASIIAHAEGKKVVEFTSIKVEHYPSVINRCQGDERNFFFIFNQYLIKCYLYPRCVQWITFVCYILHRIKHGYIGRKWSSKARNLYLESYQKECVSRISFDTWVKIVKQYGWKVAL